MGARYVFVRESGRQRHTALPALLSCLRASLKRASVDSQWADSRGAGAPVSERNRGYGLFSVSLGPLRLTHCSQLSDVCGLLGVTSYCFKALLS